MCEKYLFSIKGGRKYRILKKNKSHWRNIIQLPHCMCGYLGIFSEEIHARGVSVLRSLW